MVSIYDIGTNALCQTGKNRAFVVNERDLRNFFKIAKRWIEEKGEEYSIQYKTKLKKTSESLVSDNPETLLRYTNPREKEIRAIQLVGSSGDGSRYFEIDFQSWEHPDLIQIRVGGESVPGTEECFRQVIAEVEDTTRWYWFLSCRRWIQQLLTWVCYVFLVLSCISLIFFGLTESYRHSKANKKYKNYISTLTPAQRRVLEEKLNEETKIVRSSETKSQMDNIEKDSLQEILWRFVSDRHFIVAVCVLFGGVVFERGTIYLFPKAVFEIGKGKNRHRRLKKVRKYIGGVIGTIILMGIVVPIIKRWVLGVL